MRPGTLLPEQAGEKTGPSDGREWDMVGASPVKDT